MTGKHTPFSVRGRILYKNVAKIENSSRKREKDVI